jgi:hypothetical protein
MIVLGIIIQIFHVAEKHCLMMDAMRLMLGDKKRKGHTNNKSCLVTWDVLSLLRTVALKKRRGYKLR